MSEELKACPFCGGEIKRYDDDEFHTGWYATCRNKCGFATETMVRTEEDLIEYLNHRPIEDALRQRVNQLDSMNRMLIDGQHRAQEVALKYKDRIQELEEQLEAYSAVGTSLMRSDLDGAKRIKELENQVFTLSAGTRNSRDKERVKELEAWQKEAHPYLVNYRNSLHPDSSMYLAVEKLIKLIEQAEEHGK